VLLFGGWNGARVMPGNYSVKITANGLSQIRSFVVEPDPREEADPTQLARVEQSIQASTAMFNEMMTYLQKARNVRQKLQHLQAENASELDDINTLIGNVVVEIDQWEKLIVQPKHQTFEDDINWPNMLDRQVKFLIDNFDRTAAPVQSGGLTRLKDLQAQWKMHKQQLDNLFANQIEALNQSLNDKKIRHLDRL
jgi:hypothetical protein